MGLGSGRTEFTKADELQPGSVSLELTNLRLIRYGPLREAIEHDPVNASLLDKLGQGLSTSGQFEAAAAGFRKLFDLAPTFVCVHWDAAHNILYLNKYSDALAEIRERLRTRE